MAKGDHIFTSIAIDGNPFTHHGIDCGNGTVIHYDGEKIARISRSEFGKGKNIFTKEYDECDPSNMVVQRAESRLGEAKYNAFTNNCEHFAHWCKTGKHKSAQVDTSTRTGSGGAKGVGSFGVQVVTELAQHSAYQALNPVAKGLVKIGLQKSPKVAVAGRAAMGIAGIGSVVSGLATELVSS
jgi:Lecithin retinol acyltransferase